VTLEWLSPPPFLRRFLTIPRAPPVDQTTLFGEKIPSFTQRTSLRSLREIEDLTGFDFKRIKKRIGHLEPKKREGSIHYYDAKEVLPSLYSEAENKEKPL